MPESIQRS